MRRRAVAILGVLALSVVLVGPLADDALARHTTVRQYPPGARRCTVTINRAGDKLFITINCNLGFTRLDLNLRSVRIVIRSTPVQLGTFTLDEHGELQATVPVPESVKPGLHHLEVWQGDSPLALQPEAKPEVVTAPDGAITSPILERIPLTVQGSAEDRNVLVGSTAQTASMQGSGERSSAAAPLTAAAIGLVGIGAGGAIVARRRRNAADEGTA